jgi:hypothetical protein
LASACVILNDGIHSSTAQVWNLINATFPITESTLLAKHDGRYSSSGVSTVKYGERFALFSVMSAMVFECLFQDFHLSSGMCLYLKYAKLFSSPEN